MHDRSRQVSVVVITGGPCAGKSTFMAVARQYLEDRGFRVAIQPEVATEFITSGFSPVGGWKDPLLFQNRLLSYMIDREDMYKDMLLEQDTEKPLVLLCDRGVLDAIAYVGREVFAEVVSNVSSGPYGEGAVEILSSRYVGVVHLVTAADGAEDFYTLANNSARSESPEVARDLDQRTVAAWMTHPHLTIIDNRTGFEEKMHRALTSLSRVLGMPIPLEKERKFKVLNFDQVVLPQGTVRVEILQTYLTNGSDGAERRVRSRTVDGSTSFYFTRKLDQGEKGVRGEEERQISREEYEEFLREHDPDTTPVKKVRFVFSYGGHVMELDVYESPVRDLVVLEVEVGDMQEEISLPPYLLVEEVTGDLRYKNRQIAGGSFSA